jgi:steroid 5-alpha reductase family enzyme
MMDLFTIAGMVVCLAAGLATAMTGAWALALRTGRSGWIDAVWSISVGMAAIAAALWPLASDGTDGFRRIAVALFVGVWSMRLGGHIARRSLRGGDDPRYAELRRQWGARAGTRLFWFLQIQAAVALVLALSAGAAAHAPGAFGRPQDMVGLPLLVLAIVGESVADRQLAAFRRSRTSAVCDRGLWGYSRHPNYFFEWLAWFAMAIVASDLTGAYPAGWFALLGAALMYLLLVHASGVPPLEAHMLRTRGAAFRDYQARVSAFWPWLPLRTRDISGR